MSVGGLACLDLSTYELVAVGFGVGVRIGGEVLGPGVYAAGGVYVAVGLADAAVCRVSLRGGTGAVASGVGCEVLLCVVLALRGAAEVEVGDSALGVALGVVLGVVVGVTVAEGQSVGRPSVGSSVGSSVGVEVDGVVAVGAGCDGEPANGHHQCHQLGRGQGVPVAVDGACVGIPVSLCVGKGRPVFVGRAVSLWVGATVALCVGPTVAVWVGTAVAVGWLGTGTVVSVVAAEAEGVPVEGPTVGTGVSVSTATTCAAWTVTSVTTTSGVVGGLTGVGAGGSVIVVWSPPITTVLPSDRTVVCTAVDTLVGTAATVWGMGALGSCIAVGAGELLDWDLAVMTTAASDSERDWKVVRATLAPMRIAPTPMAPPTAQTAFEFVRM